MAWTSEMDRCLSDILVEQVKKGNRIDGTFKAAAYRAALTALNENFGLDLTKGHIQNRLKTWKKQFGILKELLPHKGFRWDETQKMVIADNSVWNDYIKTHPDARIFRNRHIQNYDQLYIIFGDYNEPAAAVDVSSIQCGVMAKDQGRHMSWTNEMDSCLAKVLVEQMKIGNKNKLDKKFKPAAFEVAVLAIKENFHLDLTKDHVKNRLKTWKKQYDILQELLDQNGLEWNEGRRIVIVNDILHGMNISRDTGPDAKQLRARSIENYDELRMIVGNEPSDGHLKTCKLDVSPALDDKEGDRCLLMKK
ncbi:L10-interacting MYB domain-containing protein-like [Juglans microcarpa x Juglans regia]|uniref:L10-interacting MYB domain-containing protein-like n=1 Tax=Juglans microcarpa x Juglans regia TaxID=2249226 RepID=UPI001B7F3A9E|nr:L10-interacting MYB domain-containing protein-like [Juglans microcarpa x Juglans regia]